MSLSHTHGNQKKIHPVADIIKVSIQITLSQYFMALGGFVSAFLLSLLGTKIFAASMLISSTQLVFMTVPFAILYCVTPIISHHVGGQKDLYKVGIFFRAAMLLSLFVGCIIMIVLWNIKPLLLAFHQPEDLVDICAKYFHLFIWVVPLSALTRAFFQVALGLFKQKVVFLLSVFGLVFFAISAYILIFGKLGLPALGVQGLAVAYLLQGILNLLFMICYFLNDKTLVIYQLFSFKFYQNFSNFLTKILAMGIPIVLQVGNELLSFFITTIMIGWLGATALMAKQVTVQYLLLLVIPLFGVGQASATFVGKFYGAKNTTLLKRYGSVSMSVGLIYSTIILLLFVFFPVPFIKVFAHGGELSPEFFKLVSVLLVIVTAGQVFDSIRTVATGSLRGLGDTQYPLYVSLIGVWFIGLPLAYLLGFTFHYGLIGVALGHNVFSVLGALILWIRWNKAANAVMRENTNDVVYFDSITSLS